VLVTPSTTSWSPFPSRGGATHSFDNQRVDDHFGVVIDITEAPAMKLRKGGAHLLGRSDWHLERRIASSRPQPRPALEADLIGPKALLDQCIAGAPLQIGKLRR
jgi:hypothetical protein